MSLDNIHVCPMCRKPFQRYNNKICNSCLEQIEIDFGKIKDYLYENPGNISVGKLSKETEVAEKVILHLMREKRIEIVDTSDRGLRCSVCGKTISSGKMCEACQSKLAQTLDKTLPKVEKKESEESDSKLLLSTKVTGKMHTYKKEE